jgi:hypothetical protein
MEDKLVGVAPVPFSTPREPKHLQGKAAHRALTVLWYSESASRDHPTISMPRQADQARPKGLWTASLESLCQERIAAVEPRRSRHHRGGLSLQATTSLALAGCAA